MPIEIFHADYGPYRWQIREVGGQLIWRAATKQVVVAHVAIELGFTALPEVHAWTRKVGCDPSSRHFPLDKALALVEKIVADYHWKRVLERIDWRHVPPRAAYRQALDSLALVSGRLDNGESEEQQARWKASVGRVLALIDAGARAYAADRHARLFPGRTSRDLLVEYLREHKTDEMRRSGLPVEHLAEVVLATLTTPPHNRTPSEVAMDPDVAVRVYTHAMQQADAKIEQALWPDQEQP